MNDPVVVHPSTPTGGDVTVHPLQAYALTVTTTATGNATAARKVTARRTAATTATGNATAARKVTARRGASVDGVGVPTVSMVVTPAEPGAGTVTSLSVAATATGTAHVAALVVLLPQLEDSPTGGGPGGVRLRPTVPPPAKPPRVTRHVHAWVDAVCVAHMSMTVAPFGRWVEEDEIMFDLV